MSSFQDTTNDRVIHESTEQPENRPRNRWGDEIKHEPSSEREDRPRNRWGEDIRREPGREPEAPRRNPWGDEMRAEGDYHNNREPSFSDEDHERHYRRDSARDDRRDSGPRYTKDNDPYWYSGKGDLSHPTKMPSQNPHDPRPRNPKRTKSCREESPGRRHMRFERKHERREDEREALLSGRITPPPGAGPNWAKNRVATLEKYAKRTQRRHEKRMRKAAEAEQAPK